MSQEKKQNTSLFISRSLQENSVLYKLFTDYNIEIIAEPLIKTTQIPFSHTPKTDWIFFSSKNAIRYFFAQNPQLIDSIKYGVISNSSANELSLYNKEAHFIGQGIDLLKIAKQFRETLANASVLFPQAMDSMQTIQKQLAFCNTTHNIYTYKTIMRNDFEVPYTDIVIFTSPSNVNAYHSKYKIDPRQTVIAMGQSTKYRLSEFGIKNVAVPCEFSENGLFECVLNLLNESESQLLTETKI